MDRNIYYIEAGEPFLSVLVDGIDKHLTYKNLQLKDSTIYLPNRRAVTSLKEAFLNYYNKRALLMPTILPIGDLDDQELMFELAESKNFSSFESLPPMPNIQRRLLLTKLVLAVEKDNCSLVEASQLAFMLGKFIDQVQTDRLSFDNLDNLVPNKYSEHWQKTLNFLKIVGKEWPNIIQELGFSDPIERRNQLLINQIQSWSESPPQGLVVAAGSTGSIPATADLLCCIEQLPNGVVILPGLNVDTIRESHKKLEPTHPQYFMDKLLTKMDVKCHQLKSWGSTDNNNASCERRKLVKLALDDLPSGNNKININHISKNVLQDLEYVECNNIEDEAGIIALMIRESLEIRDSNTAFITPNRQLARRVISKLLRWDIVADDSGGIPLSNTGIGTFLISTAEMVIADFSPINFLIACKHTLAGCNLENKKLKKLLRDIEIDFLRNHKNLNGLDRLISLIPEDNIETLSMLNRLKEISSKFAQIVKCKNTSLSKLIESHLEFCEHFAETDSTPGLNRLWGSEEGQACSDFIADFHKNSSVFEDFSPIDYVPLLKSLLSETVFRSSLPAHPRLQIWGPLEARLQEVGLLILGGLNEGVWPSEIPIDPWMNKQMGLEFGLSAPEGRIGLSAHDFAQAFCAPKIKLTRSRTSDGASTLKSRWIWQIEQKLEAFGYSLSSEKNVWNQWLYLLDKPKNIIPAEPPQPRPPIDSRPEKLTVTEIEKWMRDPYSIYAKHILRLKPLKTLHEIPTFTDFGNIVHGVFNEFLKQFPLYNQSLDKSFYINFLTQCGKKYINNIGYFPEISVFWESRIIQIYNWFIDKELSTKDPIKDRKTEVLGKISFLAGNKNFTLTAVADRIDIMENGNLLIIDYKTGTIPSGKEVEAGFSPQLPLEAVIASNGGFSNIKQSNSIQLEYWRVRGVNNPGEVVRPSENIVKLQEDALKGLKHLVEIYQDKETPYPSRPNPSYAPQYSDYEHLARVREWSTFAKRSK